MGTRPLITIGIVTRNRRLKLREAIRSVYEQEFPDLEIVVVDNDSGDGTAEMLQTEYPGVRLLRLEENLGCPGGRNYLYRHARGEIILNLDDDGQLGPEALPRLIKTFAADPKIGVVANRLFDPGSPVPKAASDRWWDIGNFLGGASAFRTEMLKEIGFFPDDFFFFKEEEFLSLKALDAGWRIVYNPGIIIYHPPLPYRSAADISRDYYLFRNPLFVVIELFPGIYLWKYLFLRIASYALISSRRGSFLAYCRAVGAVPKKLARSLFRRRPVGKEALCRYLMLRGSLPVPGEGE
jgi:GT2 family glycosyltransferase